MKTRRNISEGQIERYLSALKELHLILNNTSKLSLQKFCKNHNINYLASRALIDGGIINAKQKGANPLYEWNSIPPNKHMAVKLIQELRAINDKKIEKKQTKVEKEPNKEPKKEQSKGVSFYEIKLFFGLITIKITPIYNQNKDQ